MGACIGLCEGRGENPDCICGGSGLAVDAARYLQERLQRAETVLTFYADPETYFAIGFFPDPPNGEFMEDFAETHLGPKPGRRAREYFESLEKKP